MINKLPDTHVHLHPASVYKIHGYSLQDLLCNFYKHINECINQINTNEENIINFTEKVKHEIETQNNVINSFIEYMKAEGIPPIVIETIKQMFNDGRLSDLFDELTNRIITELNEKINSFGINILAYKKYVVGNDWTNALTKALEDYNKVFFPKGEYHLSSINVTSNKEIYGCGRDTVFIPLSQTMFEVTGSIETEINLLEDMVDFTNTINALNTENINKNDFILLKSQRDCLDYNDCGDNWTLGYSTPGSQGAFFGEFLQVDGVCTNKIITKNKTIFPFYYSSKRQETSPNARECSTVAKVNFNENVIIRDFKVIGKCNPVINSKFAKNLKVKNIVNEVNNYVDGMTGLITFRESYLCVAEDCSYTRYGNAIPTQHHFINVYRITSSMMCGFKNCFSDNATQSIDISYATLNICSSLCFCEGNNLINAIQSGITTHGGTYKCTFLFNRLYNCNQGIACRTRSSVICNNMVNGVMDFSSDLKYGIGLYEGHAVDCVISNNTIANFNNGVVVADGGDIGETFRNVNALITNNIITNCKNHLKIVKNSKALLDNMNINFTNNVCKTSIEGSYGIYLPKNCVGINIKDNIVINTNKTKLKGVWCGYDCYDITVEGNIFQNMSTGVFIRGIQSELITTPKSVFVRNNKYINCDTDMQIGVTLRNEFNEKFEYFNFEKKITDDSIIPPLSFFINSEGSLCYKGASGTINKISFVQE